MSGIELCWLGQSGFRIRDPAGGPLIYIDPFFAEHEGRTWSAPEGPQELARADVILCTHEHIDHFDQPTLQDANGAAGAHFQLVLPEPVVDQALLLGIPRERVHGTQPGEILTFGAASVYPVAASHGLHMEDAYGLGREISQGLVRFLGYIIDLGGVRLYHAGDCIPFEGQAEVVGGLKPMVALLPISGRDYYRERELDIVGNMQPEEAARMAHDIGADILIPIHWGLFSFNPGYPGELVAFAEKDYPELTVLVMGRGARVVLASQGD